MQLVFGLFLFITLTPVWVPMMLGLMSWEIAKNTWSLLSE